MNILCKVSESGKQWLRRSNLTKQDHRPEMIGILKYLEDKAHPDYYKANISPALFSIFNPGRGHTQCRGMCSNQTFYPDDKILVIPEDLLLTAGSFDPPLEEMKCDLHHKLAIFLYLEDAKGENSRIYPYLITYPPQVSDHPLYLPPKLRAALPSKLKEILETQRKHLKKGFKLLKNFVPNPNFQRFLYFWICVNERSVYFPRENDDEGLALAPFLDLLNHSPDPNAKISRTAAEGSPYMIIATKKINKYEQITIGYGEHPNHLLWTEYGFVPWVYNPDESIPVENLTELIPEDGSRLSKLVWNALKHDPRKVELVASRQLDTELHVLDNNVSHNLSLLTAVMCWDPDQGDFNSQVDSSTNVDFWRLSVYILEKQLSLYTKTLSTFNAEGVSDGAIGTAVEFLIGAIDFLEIALDGATFELDYLLHENNNKK